MRKNVIKEEDRDKALEFYGQIHDIVSEMMENPAIRIEGMNELAQRRLCDLLERTGNLWVEDPQKEAKRDGRSSRKGEATMDKETLHDVACQLRDALVNEFIDMIDLICDDTAHDLD